MSNMKSIGLFPLVTAWLLVSIDMVSARAVRIWSYQELLDKSDLVVIATPTAISDTEEHIDLPGFNGEHVVGVYGSPVVETQKKLGLDIANVLKQCQTIQPGMTRAELSTVFSTEGGLSTVTHRTYVYRDCPYIKVEVDFAPSVPQQDVEKP